MSRRLLAGVAVAVSLLSGVATGPSAHAEQICVGTENGAFGQYCIDFGTINPTDPGGSFTSPVVEQVRRIIHS